MCVGVCVRVVGWGLIRVYACLFACLHSIYSRPPRIGTDIYTYTHTHNRTNTHLHGIANNTCMHACMHIHIHTDIHTHIHTYSCIANHYRPYQKTPCAPSSPEVRTSHNESVFCQQVLFSESVLTLSVDTHAALPGKIPPPFFSSSRQCDILPLSI